MLDVTERWCRLAGRKPIFVVVKQLTSGSITGIIIKRSIPSDSISNYLKNKYQFINHAHAIVLDKDLKISDVITYCHDRNYGGSCSGSAEGNKAKIVHILGNSYRRTVITNFSVDENKELILRRIKEWMDMYDGWN